MPPKSLSVRVAVGFVSLSVVFGLWLVLRPSPANPPAAPLPSPNGYDELLRAGRLSQGGSPGSQSTDGQALRAHVEKNAMAITLAHRALIRQFRVPTQFSHEWMTNHLEDSALLKQLTHALVAEGRLTELEGRPGEAAKSYLAAVRLGQEGFRGGIMIDTLNSLSCQALGLAPLQRLVAQLNAKECRELIDALERLHATRETYREVMRRQNVWMRRACDWREKLARLIQFRERLEGKRRFKDRIQRIELQTRVVMLDLAVRAYEVEKGERPNSIDAVVPAYLRELPDDPLLRSNVVSRFGGAK